MSANAYEILALGMRYVFAALMVLIVLRGWRISVIDSRRARKLRKLSPETGIVGEMLVLEGDERARRGMRYPVTLEGSIGSSRRADIRIRHSTVRARHAIYQMTNHGLYVRGHARARISDATGLSLRETTLKDGDILRIGRVRLLLVLTGADSSPEEMVRRVSRRYGVEDARPQPEAEFDDGIFVPDVDADDLFSTNPAGGFAPEADELDERQPRRRPAEVQRRSPRR